MYYLAVFQMLPSRLDQGLQWQMQDNPLRLVTWIRMTVRKTRYKKHIIVKRERLKSLQLHDSSERTAQRKDRALQDS